MGSIQECYTNMLTGVIAPALREHGLKGSGQNFCIPSDDYWSLISFQRSVYNNSEQLKFTINLFVITKAEWNTYRIERSYVPVKPSATTHWAVGWSRRIGTLLPSKNDHWWTLDFSTNTKKLSMELVDSIVKYALPAMHEKMPTEK